MIAEAKERSEAKGKGVGRSRKNDHPDFALCQLRVNYLCMFKDRLIASSLK